MGRLRCHSVAEWNTIPCSRRWCNGLRKVTNLDIQLGPTSWCKINIAKLCLECICICRSCKTWGKKCPVVVWVWFFFLYRLLKLLFLHRHISFSPQLVTDWNNFWQVFLKLPHCAYKSDEWSIVCFYSYLRLAASSVQKVSPTFN